MFPHLPDYNFLTVRWVSHGNFTQVLLFGVLSIRKQNGNRLCSVFLWSIPPSRAKVLSLTLFHWGNAVVLDEYHTTLCPNTEVEEWGCLLIAMLPRFTAAQNADFINFLDLFCHVTFSCWLRIILSRSVAWLLFSTGFSYTRSGVYVTAVCGPLRSISNWIFFLPKMPISIVASISPTKGTPYLCGVKPTDD